MVFQAVPNVAQCQIMGRVDGQLTINDLYFAITGGGITITNLHDLVLAVEDWVGTTLAPILSDDWTCERVVAVDLSNDVGARFDLASGAVGGVAGEANPNNVAACISFRTGLRGRSFRGRNYVPGIPGSVVTLNTMDPTFINDLELAYTALVGPGTFLAGWEFVVVSRVTGGVVRDTGIATPVTFVVVVGNAVRSMRSREVGHGA